MPRSQYPEFIQGENVKWKKTFYSDINKVTPIDPTSVVFKLKKPSGSTVTPTVVDETGTGIFSASSVLDEYGVYGWRWETSSPTIVDQGFIVAVVKNTG